MNTADHRNRALCAAWLDWLTRHGRRSMTTYQYAQKLEHLCQFVGDRPLESCQITELEAFCHRQRRGNKPPSAATVERDVVVLRGLYAWANTHGHMTTNSASDLVGPSVKNHNPKAIPDDLWRRVWGADLTPEMRVVLGLGFYCGLRREEMCRLQDHHFVDDKIQHFPRKGDRNDKNTGTFPYVSCAQMFAEHRPDLLSTPEDLLKPLSDLVSAADPWVVSWGQVGRKSHRSRPSAVGPPPGMTNPDVVNRRMGLLMKRLGLPSNAFTPHALRHSFATNLLGMGVDVVTVSHLCNHSSLDITMRYLRVAEDPLARFLGKSLTGRSRWE